MKVIFTALTSVVAASVCALDQPQRVAALGRGVNTAVQEVLFAKDLQVTGLKVVRRREVDRLIPAEKSVPWWLINGRVVEARLLTSPLIFRANVASCQPWRWGCFKIEIEERKAGFFALVGAQGWLVGSDGGLIMPVAAERIAEYRRSVLDQAGATDAASSGYKRLPLVEGLWAGGESPDVVRQRLENVRRAIDIIEKACGLPVAHLRLASGQDVEVRLSGLELIATFDVSPEDILGGRSQILADRSVRLKSLLDELGPRKSVVERVDLAFEKIAVIKAKGPADK